MTPRRTAIACCFVLLGAMSRQATAAGRVFNVPTATDSHIRVEMASWLDACPPVGCAPFTINITNDSTRKGSWTFTATDTDGSTGVTTLTVEVDAGKSVAMPFYPMAGMGRTGSGGYWRNLMIHVTGDGVGSHSQSLQQPSTMSSGSASDVMPFLAVSAGLAEKGWSALVAKYDSHRGGTGTTSLDATQVSIDTAPEDWRGYSGLARLWMTDGEWSKMGTAAKSAMMDWVALGGEVRVFCTDQSDARLAAMKMPPQADGERRHGAGRITLQMWDGKTFPVDQAARLAAENARADSVSAMISAYGSGGMKLAGTIGAPTLHAGLIFAFIAIFGALVGPVNLFWLAGARHRQRMFWTTPLISIGASGMLVLLMIFQDGIGGGGARRVLALMLPGQNKLALIQEQVSRTGVLLGRGFKKNEPSWMQDVALDTRTSGYDPRENRSRRLQEFPDSRGGDWFENRSVQAHVLEAVTPSRGQIEVFPGAGAGDPPSVVSSIGMTLDKVFIVDEERRFWQAESAGTGEKKRMRSATSDEFNNWLHERATKELGPLASKALASVRGARQTAFAESSDASKLAIKTLDSIRWNDERVIFAGPYVNHDQP